MTRGQALQILGSLLAAAAIVAIVVLVVTARIGSMTPAERAAKTGQAEHDGGHGGRGRNRGRGGER